MKKKSHCILKETTTINEAKYPYVLRVEHKEHITNIPLKFLDKYTERNQQFLH